MTIADIFNASLLAHATYTDGLNTGDTGSTLASRLTHSTDGANGVTSSQADYIGDNYRVVHQQATTGSGFSATLFKDKNTNEYVFALRGTDGGVDWTQANLPNVLSGAARSQIIEMVNFYIQLTSPLNSTVNQYFYNTQTEQVEIGGSALGLGEITSSTNLTVTGHSLGGHLASAFTLLFPSVSTQTITFDSAGFIALGGNNLFPAYSQDIASTVTELSINPTTTPSRRPDPLAFDLNGDGKVDTLPLWAGVHFDIDNSGFAEQTRNIKPFLSSAKLAKHMCCITSCAG